MSIAVPQQLVAQDFQEFAILPGANSGVPYGINSTGSIVAGTSELTSNHNEATRWLITGNPLGLGILPGYASSNARGISGDGSTVVGYSSISGTLHQQAFRWTSSAGMVGLGVVPGDILSSAYAANRDGSVIVGYSATANRDQAMRWTASTGMVSLGFLPGGTNSNATGVSADGLVIVGDSYYRGSGTNSQPFVWTASGGMVGLGFLPGRNQGGATAVSADGRVVIGTESSTGSSTTDGFRWTSSTGLTSLGTVPGAQIVNPLALNADGSVVVGTTSPGNSSVGIDAFRWTAATGIQSIKAILTAHGDDLSGWQLTAAQSISADGTVIVGDGSKGLYPNQSFPGWMAVIPVNAFALLDLAGNAHTLGSLLWGGTVTNSGAVAATLTVGGDNTDTVFTGSIRDGTGTTALAKVGAGTTVLTGASTYTGGTTVNGGGLVVNGSLASGVLVNSGGTLGGSGTIAGAVVNSGTLAPGNFNTLSVSGSYVQNSGGVYQVAVNSAGQTGLLEIAGAATLGGAVSVQAAPGAYSRNTSYTILSATGTIAGAFSSVSSNLAFLTPSLSYQPHAVTLTLIQSANAFSNGARTGSQRAIGAVLDQASLTATGDFANVLNAISVLDTVQGPRALDAIGGQNYAGFSSSAVQGASAFMNAFAMQVGGGSGGAGHVAMAATPADVCGVEVDGACDMTELQRWGVWGGGLGGAGTVAGDANTHGTSYNFGGFAGGLDYRFDPSLMAGVTVGYTASNLYTQGMDGTGYSGAVQLGVYGEYTVGQVYLDGLAGYARGDNQMQRPIVIVGLQPRTALGKTIVDQFFGQLEAGYKIELGGAAQAFVTPFGRLQASTATQAAFSETGADSLDLNVAAQTTNSLRTVVGAQLGGVIGKATMKFRLGWSHELADTSRPVTASFAGAPALSFTTAGAAAPRDGVVLGLSADAPIADATSIYARYDGDLQGGNTNHIFSAGVRYVW